ncbi:MAG: NAD(P)H-dependent oxidoreductase subunit E [Malacoplasma sp.]|nr:NAD(P)H-dependent oxidoreductase subunit E [Malacoplasma sp.]
MQNEKEKCNNPGNELWDKFTKEVDKIRKMDKGTKLMALQSAQVMYGYLDKDCITYIAKAFNTSTTDLYSVASFYAQFKFTKQGKYRINLCLGTACYVRGAALVQDKLEQALGVKMGETTKDGLFTLTSARCVGCCGLAPVMMINDEVFPSMTPEKVEGIINQFKK